MTHDPETIRHKRSIRTTKNLLIFHSALMADENLTDREVQESWDDGFLTNVIVPYLEHLDNHFEDQLNRIEEQENEILKMDPEWGVTITTLRALRQVIEVLKEWRG